MKQTNCYGWKKHEKKYLTKIFIILIFLILVIPSFTHPVHIAYHIARHTALEYFVICISTMASTGKQLIEKLVTLCHHHWFLEAEVYGQKLPTGRLCANERH